ncbi:lasso peptide biosynthesis B2 protein [Nostoc sp. LEGE 12450]|uniref:lasso peptide biosynthesis B2 protein n=1 Tax=Nostoc sp. LEGE 12450 TaxID=1828643 RepID=UPI00187F459B|nr:lasso peptide biosynthesis B2 protein [Nostoc sp. LEGE 12450]MBE8990360.1 lasso peptide biosynthesis B2 protein [Nostoc sp. LEGE 12450]
MTNLGWQELKPPVMLKAEQSYHLQADVILFLQDGVARLLDFNRGRFYGLDLVSTKMLMLLIERGLETSVHHIAQEYGVAEEKVRTDLTKFLRDLQSKQLIHSQLPCSHPVVPSPFITSILLTLAWISIRTLGWTRTIRFWQLWHYPIDSNALSGDWETAVKAVDDVVRETAARYFLLPIACKERALVGWQILKTIFGFPAELVFGINLYPFQAHAWVECSSRIVTDDRSHCEIFTPAIRYC